jgi:HEPN domain-containing protein
MTAKLTELWLKYASEDLQSASVLLKENIFNMVCFHSQQSVEKLFKAIIAIHRKEIPRTHNLLRLHKICEDLLGSEIHIDDEVLLFLNDVYIDSRYPSDLGVLPSGQSDKDEAEMAFKYASHLDALLRPMVETQLKKNSG